MNNKELQEKRMRQYFIQATKGILKGEGLRNVSVRNIAREAGYSYTTMYHYFKDVNELLFLCVFDFQEEIKTFVSKQTKGKSEGLEKLKASLLAYSNYFVNYPGIFELFFLEGIGDLGHSHKITEVITKSIDEIYASDLTVCVTQNKIKETSVSFFKDQIRSAIIGSLLFYLNRRVPTSYQAFNESIKKQVDQMINCHFV